MCSVYLLDIPEMFHRPSSHCRGDLVEECPSLKCLDLLIKNVFALIQVFMIYYSISDSTLT